MSITEAQCAELAHELHRAETTRTQVRHFSSRFPQMQIEDGTPCPAPGRS